MGWGHPWFASKSVEKLLKRRLEGLGDAPERINRDGFTAPLDFAQILGVKTGFFREFFLA